MSSFFGAKDFKLYGSRDYYYIINISIFFLRQHIIISKSCQAKFQSHGKFLGQNSEVPLINDMINIGRVYSYHFSMNFGYIITLYNSGLVVLALSWGLRIELFPHVFLHVKR